MRVLLTGGAGYIGTHTAVALVEGGHEVVIIDDLSNSKPEAVRRAAELASADIRLIVGDCSDVRFVADQLRKFSVDAVIHFAGMKSVAESVADPLTYYRVNLLSAVGTLDAMAMCGVRKFVFSSSATVYELPGELLQESAPTGLKLANPYGRTKAMIEAIIQDAAAADATLEASILRYFNPVGAHGSGLMGEDPNGVPNNLMPYVAQVAAGQRTELKIFGNDYATPDGTGVRDYIHVMDLSEGHVAALEALHPGVTVANLGTGRGHSVMEVVQAFKDVSGRDVPYTVTERRPGDSAIATADPQFAERKLQWTARRTLRQAAKDAWRWQERNPQGYVGEVFNEGDSQGSL